MSKFFVGGTNLLKGLGLAELTEPDGSKIRGFLRLKKKGATVSTTIKTADKKEKHKEFIPKRREVAEPLPKKEPAGAPNVKIDVFAALPENDRIPKIIENSIKAGASSVSFFKSETSSTDAKDEKSVAVWKSLAEDVLKASGREISAEAFFFEDYMSALYAAMRSEAFLLLYENEDKGRLTIAEIAPRLKEFKSISIVSGSEMGISKNQAQLAKGLGFRLIDLGPEILRCEDAPYLAITLLMSELGKKSR